MSFQEESKNMIITDARIGVSLTCFGGTFFMQTTEMFNEMFEN